MTDEELVVQAQRGDESAFNVLYQRYWDRAVAIVRKYRIGQDVAEDIAQEAFLRVHKHLANYRHGSKFSVWLYTIVSNLRINYQRNTGRRYKVVTELFEGVDAPGPCAIEPDVATDERDIEFRLQWAIAQLPDAQRAAFMARGYSRRCLYDEIAEDQHTNLGTVKSRLARARDTVLRLMDSPEAHAASYRARAA